MVEDQIHQAIESTKQKTKNTLFFSPHIQAQEDLVDGSCHI